MKSKTEKLKTKISFKKACKRLAAGAVSMVLVIGSLATAAYAKTTYNVSDLKAGMTIYAGDTLKFNKAAGLYIDGSKQGTYYTDNTWTAGTGKQYTVDKVYLGSISFNSNYVRLKTFVKKTPNIDPQPKTNDLTYNGEPQTLMTPGATDGGTLMYSLDDKNYSTEVPKATDAGTYVVYTKVVGNDEYKDATGWQYYPVIKQAPSAIITEPEPKQLIYTGEAQELVTAGEQDYGTMQYKLANSQWQEWSAAIPKATDVGTYTVYYRGNGDKNHYGTDEKSVTVTIRSANATAAYKQVGGDITTETGDSQKDTASIWQVTVTPGADPITTLSVEVNGRQPKTPLSLDTTFSGGSGIVFGVVLNKGAADVKTFTALVNGKEVETTEAD